MLNVKRAAERLGISRGKVYELVSTGDLTHYRIDGAIRFDETHIKEFLTAHEKRGRTTAPNQENTARRPRLRHLSL